MIKLKKLIESIRQTDQIFHITNKQNFKSIKNNGLIPNVPVDMPTEDMGVYFFKTKDDALDAFVNWYSDRFDDDVEFMLLTVSTVGLRLFSTLVDWEYISYETVPFENIIKIESID